MRLDETAGNVETKSEAATVVLLHLPEPVEDGFQFVRRDAHAAVLDGKSDVVSRDVYGDDDDATGRAELHRVCDQVPENLEDSFVIHRDLHVGRRSGFQRDFFGGSLTSPQVDGLRDDQVGEPALQDESQIPGIVAKLTENGLPNLYIPPRTNFIKVEALPVLGTGKMDLRGLKRIAMERLRGT